MLNRLKLAHKMFLMPILAGAAVLVIDHDMTFLLPLAQRLVCLDAGRVIAHGRPDEVVEEPAVIAAYFGAPVISSAAAP